MRGRTSGFILFPRFAHLTTMPMQREILAVFIFVIFVLAAFRVRIARRFLYGRFHGANLFVVLEVNGQTLVYKNPRQYFGIEDFPLTEMPHEIFDPSAYETYYNVCWFDCGTLFRCDHMRHRTKEDAAQCYTNGVAGSMIGKILEER